MSSRGPRETAILKIEVAAGCAVADAAAEACRLARLLGVVIVFDFNGAHCLACRFDTPATVEKQYWDFANRPRVKQAPPLTMTTPDKCEHRFRSVRMGPPFGKGVQCSKCSQVFVVDESVSMEGVIVSDALRRIEQKRDRSDREVAWYRINGKHPARISRRSSGGEYVIGDWSWNRDNPQAQEWIEPQMSAALSMPEGS